MKVGAANEQELTRKIFQACLKPSRWRNHCMYLRLGHGGYFCARKSGCYKKRVRRWLEELFQK